VTSFRDLDNYQALLGVENAVGEVIHAGNELIGEREEYQQRGRPGVTRTFKRTSKLRYVDFRFCDQVLPTDILDIARQNSKFDVTGHMVLHVSIITRTTGILYHNSGSGSVTEKCPSLRKFIELSC
jgi:hypothetical protein